MSLATGTHSEAAHSEGGRANHLRLALHILEAESHTVSWPDVGRDGSVVLRALRVGETAGGGHQETVRPGV